MIEINKKLIWMLLCILIFNTVNAGLSDDLVSYHSMDDDDLFGTNSYDKTGNGNNMTLVNSPTTGVIGIIDQMYAYFSSGSPEQLNSAAATTNYDVTSSDNLTVSFWINTTRPTNEYRYIFANRVSGTEYYSLRLTGGGGYVNFQWRNDGSGGFCQGNGNSTINDGKLHHIVWIHNGTDCDVDNHLFVDGTKEVMTTPTNNDATEVTGSNKLDIGVWNDGVTTGSDAWVGGIDEVYIKIGNAMTDSEVLELYNDGAGFQYPFVVPPVVANVTNTSLYMVDFNISDFTFSTETPFIAFTIEYPISPAMNLSLLTSFNTVKNTGAGTNQIWGRIVTDDGVILDEKLLRTVSDIGKEGVTSFNPIRYEELAGIHNLSFYFWRTGNGEVEVNDLDMFLQQFYTTQNQSVRSQITNDYNTVTETGFSPMVNFSINTVQTLIGSFAKVNVNSTLPSITSFRFQDVNTNGTGRLRRSLLSPTEVGSVGTAQLDFVNYNNNFSLAMKTDGNPVSYNATILDFDFIDALNNTIIIDSYVFNGSTHNAGPHLIGNINYTPKDGNSIFVFTVAGFNSSTGEQDPIFYVNSTNESLSCFNRKDRGLSSNSEIGNYYAFTQCNSGLELNKEYNFNLYVEVETGETLNIEGGAIALYETTEFNVTLVPTSKSMNVFTDLVNNTINYNLDTLNITYNFTIGVFNTIDQANCTLVINGVNNQTQTLRNDSVNYEFQLDNVGKEEEYNLSVDCLNSEISASTGIFNYKIDTVSPRIESSFTNNSQQLTGNPISFYVNFTDPNLFAYNITWFDINGNVNQNVFAENLTGGFAENTSTYTEIAVTNGSIYIQAWDSHTSNRVTPMDWYWANNKLYAHGVEFEGEFKIYNNKHELITYFYQDFDRYKLKATFEDKLLFHEFNITAPGWKYIGDLHGYKGHFITYGNPGHWLDFEGSNIESVEVVQVGEDKFNIRVELFSPSDEVEFESIGDLNFNEATYYYSVIDSSVLNNLLLQELIRSINNQTNTITELENQKEGFNMYLWFWIFAVIILILVIIFHKNHYLFFFGIPTSVLFVFIGVAMFDDLVSVTHPAITNALYQIQWAYLILGVLAIFMKGIIMFFQAIGIMGKKESDNNQSDIYANYRQK